jgi:hypothetical protein
MNISDFLGFGELNINGHKAQVNVTHVTKSIDFYGTSFELKCETLGKPVESATISKCESICWINGYKWGVEYQTNGEKPDLPDDLVIEWLDIDGKWIKTNAKGVCWTKAMCGAFDIEKFRIVDERYKPVEQQTVSAAPITNFDDCSIEMAGDWYDYEHQKSIAFPPEKTRCQVEIGGSWQEGLLIASHGNTCWFLSDFGGYMMLGAERFRPLDHATRSKDIEREQIVDAAIKATDCPISRGAIRELYDKGFLKLPE